MKKLLILLISASSLSLFAQGTFTKAEVDNSIRLTLEPSHLSLKLPESASPIITSIAVAGTRYKIGGADQLEFPVIRDFSYDVGNDRFFFDKPGAVDVLFHFSMSQSFSQNAAAAEVITRLEANGVPISGLFVRRTIGNANTKGVISIEGHFRISHLDYLTLTIESDKVGDFSAWSFMADLKEEGE